MSKTRWWEAYKCGCVSPIVDAKRNLPGYCPKHGDDRNLLIPEHALPPGRRNAMRAVQHGKRKKY